MTAYDITVEITTTKSYRVEAKNVSDAETLALELAIKEFPGHDVWLRGEPKVSSEVVKCPNCGSGFGGPGCSEEVRDDSLQGHLCGAKI